MIARTVIAPIERVKIIFQTKSTAGTPGWTHLFRQVVSEGGGGLNGVASFWKGNSVAVLRVFPYLGVQLSSNEFFKKKLGSFVQTAGGPPLLGKEAVGVLSGGAAGMSAVISTYPLDLARARMALLGLEQNKTIIATLQQVISKDGWIAIYSGAGVSMSGAALYCGIKFASYDFCKEFLRQHFLADPDAKASALHRAVSGGLAGVFAQTFVYPFDVLRRRLQTGGQAAREKYPDSLRGLWRLYSEEGIARGLYRGLSLNYLKTVPNTTVYLALFDFLKDLKF